MTTVEKKINALARLALAETEEGKEDCLNELRALMTGAEAKPNQVKNTEAGEQIHSLLQTLGVPSHLKGHSRLACAIKLVADDPDLIHAATGELYPKVAELLSDTPSRVERSIRHAIESAWNRCDLEVLQDYFGNTVSPNKGKPTNSEFISTAAYIIRRQTKAA